VFSNLVANAMQHGTPGPIVSVRVDGTRLDVVHVEVHNHGAISLGLLPNLFEPMSGGEHRHARSQGLGLGLYISQQIVKGHGGSIEVRSSDASGTTFVVVLPRAPDLSARARRAR
jgi:signal transduction histidine kinase